MVHDCRVVDYKSNYQNENISKAHGNVTAPLTRIISSRNSEKQYNLGTTDFCIHLHFLIMWFEMGAMYFERNCAWRSDGGTSGHCVQSADINLYLTRQKHSLFDISTPIFRFYNRQCFQGRGKSQCITRWLPKRCILPLSYHQFCLSKFAQNGILSIVGLHGFTIRKYQKKYFVVFLSGTTKARYAFVRRI